MKIKFKTSIVLSSLVLGAINLSAVQFETILNNQTLEIDNNYKINTFYISNNSQLINKNTNSNRLDIENSKDSIITNNSSLNIIDDWSAINAKIIDKSSIINNGNINILGNTNNTIIHGIDVTNLIESKIVNNGNIVTNSNSNSDTQTGIVVRAAKQSSIRNTGLIDLKANVDDGYLVGIMLSGYFQSQNNGVGKFNSSEIINDKDIIVSSKGRLVSSYGITAYDFVINDSQIINNGIISVSSEGVYADSAGMELEDLNDSQIINNGTIKSYSSVINNSDNDNFADSFGISIEDTNNIKIGNIGNILINSNNLNKENALAEAISAQNFNNSILENSGTIKSTINNKLDKNASAILFNNSSSSTVTNSSSGKIYGNIVLNGDSTLKNKGFISLPYNANKNAKFVDKSDTILLQPSIRNLINSGTIEIGAYKDSAGNIENTQIKTVNATFEKGSKMQVDVVAGSKAFIKGDTLSEVVTATDKLTINELTLNKTKLADNSALLDFEYKQNDNKLDIVVSNVEKLSNITENKNKVGVTKALDTIMENIGSYPQMDSLVSSLQSLSESEIDNAVSSLVPTTAAALVGTSSQINSTISNIISTRLGNLGSGLNSGDEIAVDKNRLWTKVYGGLGKQKDKDSIAGFDLKTYGLGIGYDREYKENQIVGFGTFYTNAKVEVNNLNHENDVDAYSLVAYGSNLLRDEKTTVYYQGSHTWQKNDSKRAIFTGEIANSKFTSKTLSLDLKLGHKLNISDSLSFEPYTGLTYRNFKNPSYTESGAGAANIKSEKFSNTAYVFNLGTNFEYKVTNDSKLTAIVGAGYDLKDDDNIVTSSFTGANGVSFDTNGIDNGRWEYIAGVGYDVDINNNNNLNIQYNYQGEGTKYSNNVLSVNYKYKF